MADRRGRSCCGGSVRTGAENTGGLGRGSWRVAGTNAPVGRVLGGQGWG